MLTAEKLRDANLSECVCLSIMEKSRGLYRQTSRPAPCESCRTGVAFALMGIECDKCFVGAKKNTLSHSLYSLLIKNL